MPEYSRYRSPDDDTDGKLFVGGLAWDSTEDSIKTYFEQFGTVLEVALKRNKDDPTKHRGFCFVKFAAQESADAVLNHGDAHIIDGSKVDPKSVCPPGVKPEQRTKKIFVGGLQDQTTDEALHEYFSAFGKIQNNIEFSIDRNSQKRRGFCFIEFANESIVDRIVRSKYHMIAGVRVETKRVLTKAQQLEQAQLRQTTPMDMGSVRSGGLAAYNTVQVAGTASSYAAQPASAVVPGGYGQPVIYIHPDSLSTIYPSSAIGGYQTVSAAAVPRAAYSSAIQTLYQPYSAAHQGTMAARGGATINVKRQAPYQLKKY